MEIRIKDGEYALDSRGAEERVTGSDEVLQRVLMRLRARRGCFEPDREYGSRLWTLGRIPRSQRESSAMQFAAEALADEPEAEILALSYAEGAGGGEIAITLRVGSRREELTLGV